MLLTPLLPASTACQLFGTVRPSGVTIPSPVTTTRCLLKINLVVSELATVFTEMGINVINGLLNCRDFFSIFIWNLGFKLFFQRHHQFHGIQRVGTQIVDK